MARTTTARKQKHKTKAKAPKVVRRRAMAARIDGSMRVPAMEWKKPLSLGLNARTFRVTRHDRTITTQQQG